jgi:hypothetical protein
MDRREYGYTAVVGLLADGVIGGVVGDTLAFAGMVCAVVWIFLTIKEKRNAKKAAPTPHNRGFAVPAAIYTLAGVLLLAAAFYWYEARPRQIRTACSSWAIEKAHNGGIRENYDQREYESYYERCLRERW